MSEIKTRRLTLRTYQPQDSLALFQAYHDPQTMQYMHVQPHEVPEETRRFFDAALALGADVWTILEAESRSVIGHVQFLGRTRVPAMGYLLNRKYWGQGIAVEALTALLTFAFNERKLDRIELWINEDNHASQRVAEKLGFRLKGRLHQRYDWEENHHIMLTYGLWADEWPETIDAAARPVTEFFAAQPVLQVTNVAQSIAFYTEKLGFDLDFVYGDPPVHAGVARGNWSSKMAYLQISEVAEGTEIRPQGYLYLMVDAKIDALHALYESRGVEIISPLETYPWKMREFAVRDPDGHVLRFGTSAPLD